MLTPPLPTTPPQFSLPPPPLRPSAFYLLAMVGAYGSIWYGLSLFWAFCVRSFGGVPKKNQTRARILCTMVCVASFSFGFL